MCRILRASIERRLLHRRTGRNSLGHCGLSCGSGAAAQGPSVAALRKAFGGHAVKR